MTNEPNSSLNFAAAQKLAGCYLLERALDASGGNPIWIAQDEVLGKTVSLHFLPPAITRDVAAIEELRQEVKRNRPLIHPGVLRVYDLVEGADWTAVAMEAFEGRSLAAELAKTKRFEVEEVEAWLDQICVALEEAHRLKLTHRDLAPDNVFITSAGRLLVANFGISRIVQNSLAKAQPAELDAAHWSTLSPQLLDGAAPSPTDDVYGVGALFFHLLAGRPVFEGADIREKIR
ncbi:MAG TPA: protein kinase, partial [Chthoniobacteraceae bacterium]|nr:protein kinase [Chthoniobacteraceae bacterium]